MVAVIAGNGLGLDNSSLTRVGQGIGGQAGLGQAGLDQYLNVANGNLVLRDPGQSLFFDGTSLDALRVYNSRGQLQGGGSWSFGFTRHVDGLVGQANTPGSTVTRTADDGSTVVYAFDAESGDYVSQHQAGTQDRLRLDQGTGQWRWTDGASRSVELYDENGRLVSLEQPQTGARFTFTWAEGHLATVAAGDGDTLTLQYDAQGRLSGMSLSEIPPGGTDAVLRQQVTYGYDTLGRLTSVTTNLASDTGATGGSYVTTYTYDGDSDRIASMVQGDGTTVSYTYAADGQGGFKVSRIVTGAGADAQAIDVAYGNGSTTVTDALGHRWTYAFSADGELLSVEAPMNNGAASRTSYEYDTEGNLTRMVDANGGVTTYAYDGHGNLILAEDPTGVTVTYTYDAHDRMLSRTVYATPAQGQPGTSGYVPPSGAETFRYVYDEGDRLAYTIDAAGAVARNTYATDAAGNVVLSSTYAWRGATFTQSGTPSLADLVAWENQADVQSLRAQGSRIDLTYDVRGQLASRTVHDVVDANGNGVIGSGTVITRTTYDAAGRLLRSTTSRGGDRGTAETTSYAYDGLGRILSLTDALGHTTSTVYLDGGHIVEITDAAGLVVTQVRNSAGLVVSTTRSTGAPPLAGETFHDAAGRPIVSVDAQGHASYTFYDSQGHVTGTVGTDGKVTLTTYDAQGNKRSSVAYATPVDTSGWLGSHGPTTALPTQVPVPPAADGDQASLWIYDDHGFLTASVAVDGSVVVTERDAQGNPTAVTRYATTLDGPTRAGLGLAPTMDQLLAVVVAADGDASSRTVFDAAGRVVYSVDESHQVTLNSYDAAGRLIASVRYQKTLSVDEFASLGTAPTADAVSALVAGVNTQVTGLWIRDDDGNVLVQIDEQGNAVVRTYAAGSMSSEIALSRRLYAYQITSVAQLPTYANFVATVNLDSASVANGVTLRIYDAHDNVVAEVTSFRQNIMTYDADGRLVGTTTYNQNISLLDLARQPTLDRLRQMLGGTGDVSTRFYDMQGRLLAVVSDWNLSYTRYAEDGSWALTTGYQLGPDDRNALSSPPSLAAIQAALPTMHGNVSGLGYFDASGAQVAFFSTDGGSFVNLRDSQGRVAVAMTSKLGYAIHVDENGTPPSLDAYIASGLDTFSNYTFFDASGQVAATINAEVNFKPGDGYGVHPSVTIQVQDVARGIRAEQTFQQPMTSAQFAAFAAHPTLDGLRSTLTSYGQIGNYQYLDTQGRVVAQFQGGLIIYTDYDDQGRIASRRTSSLFGHVYSDISEMPSLEGLKTQARPDNANPVVVYQYTDDGYVTYDLGWDLSINRYDHQGHELAHLGYTDSIQQNDRRLIGADPTVANVQAYIRSHGMHVREASFMDASGNSVAEINAGDITYSVSVGKRILRYSIPADVFADSVLHAVTSGDTSSLLAEANRRNNPQVSAIDLLDNQGRVVAHVESSGWTAYAFDAAGRSTGQISFQGDIDFDKAIAFGDSLTVDHLRAMTPHGANTSSQVTIYDAGGHLLAQVDNWGTVTTWAYDTAGRLLTTVTHNVHLTSQQVSELAAAPSMGVLEQDLAIAGGASVDQFIRDAAGRVMAHVDTQGHVERYEYDAFGRVTVTTKYATTLSIGFGIFPTLAALMSEVVPTSDDQRTLTIYDGAGRPAATVGPDGSLSVTTFDADGVPRSVVRFATPLTSQQVASLGTSPSLVQVLRMTSGRDSHSVYDAAGRETVRIDEQGLATFRFYDAQNRLVASVDSQGAVTSYGYDAAGNVVSTVAYARTLDISAWYDSNTGALVPPVALPAIHASSQDRTTVTLRDAAGRVATQIDAAGTVTRFLRDGEGRVVSTTIGARTVAAGDMAALLANPSETALLALWQPSVDDRTLRTIYDIAGRAAASIDAAGYVTLNTFDELGNLAGTRSYATPIADASIRSLDVLRAVLVASSEDLVTRVFHDASGRRVADIDASGVLTTTSYDETNHTVTTVRHATAFDATTLASLSSLETAASLVAKLSQDDGAQTIVDAYGADGQKISHIDESGATTRYAYDSAGRQTSWTTVDGHGTYGASVGYDAFGQVISRSNGAGDTVTSLWDVNGRLVSTTDGAGYKTWYIYDDAGRLAYQIESRPGAQSDSGPGMPGPGPGTPGRGAPQAAITSFVYDTFGDLVARRTYQSLVGLSTFDNGIDLYPEAQSATSMATWLGLHLPQTSGDDVTRYIYTATGKVASMLDGAGWTTRYSYDAFGELVATEREVSADVRVGTTYAYDARGERVSVTEAAGTTLQRTTVTRYDAFGRAVETTDPSGHSVVREYDRLGRQIVLSQVVGGVDERQSTTWDAFGRVLTQTDPMGLVTTYTYDTIHRAVTVTTPEGVVMTTARDSQGDIVSVTDGAGHATTYRYDGAGRLVETIDALGNSDSVTYEAGGTIAHASGVHGDIVTTYDGQGRVLSRTKGSDRNPVTVTYSYDGAGRIAVQTDGVGTTTFVYDGLGRLVSQRGEAPENQGPQSQTIPVGQTFFAYDGDGHLVTVTRGIGDDAKVTRYVYDALGRRTAEIADPDGLRLTTRYEYDAQDHLVRATDPMGHSVTSIYDEAGHLLYTLTPSGAEGAGQVAVTRYVYDADGNLVVTTLYGKNVDATSLASIGGRQPAELVALGAELATQASDAADRTSYVVRDHDGRVRFNIDPTGIVTETRYDALGQVSASLVFDRVLALSPERMAMLGEGHAAPGDMASWLASAGLTDATASATFSYYDAAGRVAFSATSTVVAGQQVFVVTATTYTAGGQPATRTVYDASFALANVGQGATGASIAAAISAMGGSLSTRTTSYVYDEMLHLIASTDPSGATTYYVYNQGIDKPGAIVDGAGGVTFYTYDFAGRVIATAVSVDLANTSRWMRDGKPTSNFGRRLPPSQETDTYTTTTYDTAGNLASTRRYVRANPWDGSGTYEEDVYRYDGAGRLVAIVATGVKMDAIPTIAAASMLSPVISRPEQGGSSVTEVRTTRFFNDDAGRRVATLDPTGTLTVDSLDAAGRVIGSRTFATQVPAELREKASLQAMLPPTSDADHVSTAWYDDMGRLTGSVDAGGYLTTYTYDGNGRPIATRRYAQALAASSRTDLATALSAMDGVASHATSTSYDDLGRVVSSTDVEGTVTTFTYDAAGHLLDSVVAAGTDEAKHASYRYDRFGERIAETDASGATTSYAYDATGRVASRTDALGNTTWFVYDGAGHQTYVIRGEPDGGRANASGEVLAMTYDGRGYMTSRTAYAQTMALSDGFAPTKSSMDDWVQAGSSDPSADSDVSESFTYDGRGNVISYQGKKNYEADYDGFGELIMRRSGDGFLLDETTTYEYDRNGRVVQQTDVSSTRGSGNAGFSHFREQNWTLDAFGRAATYVDGNGASTSYAYDTLDRQVDRSQVVDGVLREVKQSFDAFGRLIAQSDPLGLVTTFEYDDAARKVTTHAPGGLTTVAWHDRAGMTVRLQDAAGAVTEYRYDKAERLVETLRPDGAHLFTTYDLLGNLTSTTDAEGHAIVYGYDAAGRMLTQTVDPQGLRIVTTHTYGGHGLEVRTVDPNGAITTYKHDPNGMLNQKNMGVHADGSADLTVSYEYDTLGNLDGTTYATADGQFSIVSEQRDADGRIIATNADGVSRTYSYDGNGNLRTSTEGSRVTYYAYNEANELVAKAEPGAVQGSGLLNRVTGYRYDADGRLVATTTYATGLPNDRLGAFQYNGYGPGLSGADAVALLHLDATPSDRTSYRVYDALGRAAYDIDAAGAVTQTRYDEIGRPVASIAYGKIMSVDASLARDLAAGNVTVDRMASILGAAGLSEGDARITRNFYDVLGRVVFTMAEGVVDGAMRAVVTELRYDAEGHVVARNEHDTTLTGEQAASATTDSLIAWAAGSTAGVGTHSVYDAAGRLVFLVDQSGMTQKFDHDADGHVTVTYVFAHAISPSSWTLDDVANAVTIANPLSLDARAVRAVYDSIGNVIATYDVADGQQMAAYGYDGRGNRTSFTNGVGQTWKYTYQGQLLSTVTAPTVEIVHFDGSRSVEAVRTDYGLDESGKSGSLILSYDSNRWDSINYTWYDAAGNAYVTGSTVSSFDSLSGKPSPQTHDIAVTHTSFNLSGQPEVIVDGNGKRSYKVYDAAGRLAYDVDGDGDVTGYAYDAFGQVTVTTRYAQRIDTSAFPAGAAPGKATLESMIAPSADDRSIHVTYDGFGRKLSVVQSAVSYVRADGSSAVGNPTVRYTYDVHGRQTSMSTLVDGTADRADAVWATTYTWYDGQGRKTMAVDAMGYVSTWGYNAFGEVIEAVEYAAPIPVAGLSPGGAQPSLPGTGAADRVTRSTYDERGRKATESVLRDYVDGAGNPVHGFVTAIYGYDAADHVVSMNQGGRTILTTYDAAGRVASVTAPAERVLVSNWRDLLAAHPDWDLENDGLYTTGSQVVKYGYDAYGNRVVQTQSSTAGGPEQSTWYVYDSAGHELASIAPKTSGAVSWTSADAIYKTYDAMGRLATVVSTQSSDASGDNRVTVTTTYTYDAEGRQASSTTRRSNAADADAMVTTTYNAFGEVVATGNGIATKSVSSYDAAGRLVSTVDPKTGVTHTYRYDLLGHVVQDITHATGGSEIRTQYTVDLAGHVTGSLGPSTVSGNGQAASGLQATYDRWGNVLTSTDARGNTTVYTYNERNQVVTTSGPAVVVVDEHGNAAVSAPVKRSDYDIDGNVVAAFDENGNVTRTVYDAAGQVVDVIDGAGSHTRAAYDTLGREVAGQTGLASDGTLHISFKDVDGQGRVTGEGDFLLASDSSARVVTQRQVYILDNAGNRAVVYDGLGSGFLAAGDQANADLHAQFYTYDSQGHVIRSQTGAQRAATLANGKPLPPPLQQPRNMDFEAGGLAWTSEPDAVSGWKFVDGKAVYNGSRQGDIGSNLINDDAVPVVPGQKINAWADVESVGEHGGANAEIAWYAADGRYLGLSTGNIQTTKEGRGVSHVDGTAPAGAAFARIAVNATNYNYDNQVNTVYAVGWDYALPDYQLSPGLDGSIFVNLPPGTFSLQPLNPDFENGDSGWQGTEGWGIRPSDNTANGKWVGMYHGSGQGSMVNKNRVPVVPGQKITAKGRVAIDKGNGGSAAGALLILWFDKDGNQIRYNSSNVIYSRNGGAFQDVSVMDIAPPGAAYATVALSGNGDGEGTAIFDAISWDYRYIPTLDRRDIANVFTYDRDGNLVNQVNADGDTESWVRDAYGRVTDHTDMAGASYHYTYDAYSGLMTGEVDDWAGKAMSGVSKPGYVTAPVGTGNSETRTYSAAGQLTGIVRADGSSYSYAYDENGNQIRQEATTVDGNGRAVHTVTTTTYDSHNRISQVTSDDGQQVLVESYTYDAAANRRSIVAKVTAGGVDKATTTAWYTYDGANRVAVSNGALVDGTIVVGSSNTSYALSYDAAGNAAVRLTRSGGTTMLQRSQYDGRGQLVLAFYAIDLSTNQSRGVAETRTYDNNGNVVTDNQYYSLGTTATTRTNPKTDPDSPYYIGNGAGPTPGADIGGFLSTATITRYDAYGRVTGEQTFGHGQYWDGSGGETVPGPLPGADATSYGGMTLQSAVLYQGPGGSSAYDAMGNVVFYQYRTNGSRLDQYTVTYLKKDGYLQAQTSGQNVSQLENVRPATDESYYNARGERIAIAQHTQYAYGTVADTVRVFAYDGNGQIISRRDGTASGSTIDQGNDPGLRNQHYVYVGGQQVAHYDEKATLDVLSQVTAFSSGNGTGDYVVQQGDTLKSIAQAVYGNASLWYIVAQANALNGDADLAVGLSLSIPSVTTNKNDATTFKPYNPSEILGSTTPDLPVIAPPPPPPKHHCNVIAAVVVIAVAVVASFVVGPLAATALQSVAAGAAAGAAAGSIAGQLAGDVLGTHQGFSFGEVFTAATTAFVTAGVGQYLSGAGTAASASASSGLTFGQAAIQAGAGYVAQDVAAKLVGEPGHFSWAGLLSNSLAAGIAGQIGPTSSQVQYGDVGMSPWRVGVASLVQGGTSRELSLALGDRRVASWESIGESAAGQALGAFVTTKLPATSTDPSRRATGSQRDVLGDYNSAGAREQLGWSLAAQGVLDDSPRVAGSDWSAALAGVYGTTGSRSPSYAGVASTSQWNVANTDVSWGGTPGGYTGLTSYVPSATTLPEVRVTANVGGVVREDYDPLASQRWLDSQRVAFTLGLNAEADQHAASRQAADLAFRKSADVEQNRSSFSPVAPTVFSRLYDKAVAYGDSRSEDDRIFSPISYRLGTRYWPARILAGIGDVIAGFEGLSNRQWNGGFDQGNNPFTQQSRWGVENQDVRLNVAANAALVVVSGAESFAAKGMTAGASTDTFSASERVIVSENAEALANAKTVGGGALSPASGTMPAASGRIGAASADQTFTLNSVVYRLEESRYSLAGEYAGSTSPGYLSRGGDSLAVRLGGQGFVPNTASKLTFDPSLNVVDKSFSVRTGEILADNPVGSASYARLQSQGTNVNFVNDPEMASMGWFDPNANEVRVNMLLHSSPEEAASTIVHEATHQNGFFNGIPQNTQYTEYRAFRNEYLFQNGARPPLNERMIIWNDVQQLYPELPQGKYPFGGQR